jgi:hypothetical protein
MLKSRVFFAVAGEIGVVNGNRSQGETLSGSTAFACRLHVNTTRTGKVRKEKAQLVISKQEQEQHSLHHLENSVRLRPSN